jgi:hypothetical protein
MKVEYVDYLLHYDLYSPVAVYDKFRKRPAVNVCNGTYFRNTLADYARTLSFEKFNNFYCENVTYSEDELLKIKKNKSAMDLNSICSLFM